MKFDMITWNKNIEQKQKLRLMDTDSFIVYIKTKDICLNMTKDVNAKFGTLSYELERPLSIRKYIFLQKIFSKQLLD